MQDAKTLKTMLKEASIYQTQGLLADARKKYDAALLIVEETPELTNKEELLARIRRKIASLQKLVYRVEKRTVTPEISTTDKRLIQKLFSVSEEDDPVSAAIEGAMALAKFGLFERAIQEFELLLDHPDRRLEIAKHILRCHMAIRSAHDPMIQYQKWVANSHLPREELDKLEKFLTRTYGMHAASSPELPVGPSPTKVSPAQSVPTPAPPEKKTPPPPEYDPYEDSYDDVLDMLPKAAAAQSNDTDVAVGENYNELIDSFIPQETSQAKLPDEDVVEDYIDYISSVSIPVSIGPRKGQSIEVPVNLQTSDAINLIVSSVHKDVIAMLTKDAKIEKLLLNSPIATSTATGCVTAAALIDQGPQQGDYSVDLKIEN